MIKAQRMFRNYTQEYMADRLGMTQKAYSKIENHETRITVDALQRVSEILDYPIHLFFEPYDNNLVGEKKPADNNALEKLEDLYKQLLETKEAMLRAREAEIECLHRLLANLGALQLPCQTQSHGSK